MVSIVNESAPDIDRPGISSTTARFFRCEMCNLRQEHTKHLFEKHFNGLQHKHMGYFRDYDLWPGKGSVPYLLTAKTALKTLVNEALIGQLRLLHLDTAVRERKPFWFVAKNNPLVACLVCNQLLSHSSVSSLRPAHLLTDHVLLLQVLLEHQMTECHKNNMDGLIFPSPVPKLYYCVTCRFVHHSEQVFHTHLLSDKHHGTKTYWRSAMEANPHLDVRTPLQVQLETEQNEVVRQLKRQRGLARKAQRRKVGMDEGMKEVLDQLKQVAADQATEEHNQSQTNTPPNTSSDKVLLELFRLQFMPDLTDEQRTKRGKPIFAAMARKLKIESEAVEQRELAKALKYSGLQLNSDWLGKHVQEYCIVHPHIDSTAAAVRNVIDSLKQATSSAGNVHQPFVQPVTNIPHTMFYLKELHYKQNMSCQQRADRAQDILEFMRYERKQALVTLEAQTLVEAEGPCIMARLQRALTMGSRPVNAPASELSALALMAPQSQPECVSGPNCMSQEAESERPAAIDTSIPPPTVPVSINLVPSVDTSVPPPPRLRPTHLLGSPSRTSRPVPAPVPVPHTAPTGMQPDLSTFQSHSTTPSAPQHAPPLLCSPTQTLDLPSTSTGEAPQFEQLISDLQPVLAAEPQDSELKKMIDQMVTDYNAKKKQQSLIEQSVKTLTDAKRAEQSCGLPFPPPQRVLMAWIWHGHPTDLWMPYHTCCERAEDYYCQLNELREKHLAALHDRIASADTRHEQITDISNWIGNMHVAITVPGTIPIFIESLHKATATELHAICQEFAPILEGVLKSECGCELFCLILTHFRTYTPDKTLLIKQFWKLITPKELFEYARKTYGRKMLYFTCRMAYKEQRREIVKNVFRAVRLAASVDWVVLDPKLDRGLVTFLEFVINHMLVEKVILDETSDWTLKDAILQHVSCLCTGDSGVLLDCVESELGQHVLNCLLRVGKLPCHRSLQVQEILVAFMCDAFFVCSQSGPKLVQVAHQAPRLMADLYDKCTAADRQYLLRALLPDNALSFVRLANSANELLRKMAEKIWTQLPPYDRQVIVHALKLRTDCTSMVTTLPLMNQIFGWALDNPWHGLPLLPDQYLSSLPQRQPLVFEHASTRPPTLPDQATHKQTQVPGTVGVDTDQSNPGFPSHRFVPEMGESTMGYKSMGAAAYLQFRKQAQIRATHQSDSGNNQNSEPVGPRRRRRSRSRSKTISPTQCRSSLSPVTSRSTSRKQPTTPSTSRSRSRSRILPVNISHTRSSSKVTSLAKSGKVNDQAIDAALRHQKNVSDKQQLLNKLKSKLSKSQLNKYETLEKEFKLKYDKSGLLFRKGTRDSQRQRYSERMLVKKQLAMLRQLQTEIDNTTGGDANSANNDQLHGNVKSEPQSPIMAASPVGKSGTRKRGLKQEKLNAKQFCEGELVKKQLEMLKQMETQEQLKADTTSGDATSALSQSVVVKMEIDQVACQSIAEAAVDISSDED